MIKQKFTKGEQAKLIVYSQDARIVEVIEQDKYRKNTKIKFGESINWVETKRLNKFLNDSIEATPKGEAD